MLLPKGVGGRGPTVDHALLLAASGFATTLEVVVNEPFHRQLRNTVLQMQSQFQHLAEPTVHRQLRNTVLQMQSQFQHLAERVGEEVTDESLDDLINLNENATDWSRWWLSMSLRSRTLVVFGIVWTYILTQLFVFSVEHPDMSVFIQSNTGITPEKVATAIAGLLAYIYNCTSDID